MQNGRNKNADLNAKIIVIFVSIFITILIIVVPMAIMNDKNYAKNNKQAKIKPVTTQEKAPADLEGYVKYSIEKVMGKNNNKQKNTVRNVVITDKIIEADINANVGLTKSSTKDKILDNTLNILEKLNDKDYREIIFAYFLPLKDNNTMKTDDEQVFTISFRKIDTIGKLKNMSSLDLPNIAKSVVIHPALK